MSYGSHRKYQWTGLMWIKHWIELKLEFYFCVHTKLQNITSNNMHLHTYFRALFVPFKLTGQVKPEIKKICLKENKNSRNLCSIPCQNRIYRCAHRLWKYAAARDFVININKLTKYNYDNKSWFLVLLEHRTLVTTWLVTLYFNWQLFSRINKTIIFRLASYRGKY